MSKIIMALALVLMFSAADVSGEPRSAYSKANPAAVSKVDSAMKAMQTGVDDADEDVDDDNEATADDSTVWADDDFTYVNHQNPDAAERILGRVLDSKAVAASIFLILCFCILPFIFILVVVVLIYKSHKRKYEVMAKAVEKGMPVPEQVMKTEVQSDEYLWRKGIKNLFLGLGLAAFFWIMGMEPLHAIGLLMLFYGLGQMAISYASANDLLHRKKKDGDDFMVNE